MLPSIYFLGPSFVATFTARAGLDIWLPVRPPTNMLGGARPGPRAIFYASCVRTLPRPHSLLNEVSRRGE